MHKFSDFAKSSANLDGEKVSFKSLFNTTVQVLSFRTIESRVVAGRPCAQIQFRKPGEDKNFVTFTSSEVIIRQLNEYKDELPFETTITKCKKYFAFT